MAGKRPSRGTPADGRLKRNKRKAAKTAAAGPAPKFGSPAWDAKYGIKPFAKKAKRKG